jgi:RNA repair, ligase-Pnkp-associating, region of Hen1
MFLTISTSHRPAPDLGFLLHKHPGRFQSHDLAFGKAHVFYPEASDDQCTACLLLEVDPVGLVRGKRTEDGLLDQYVNDRPYAASSFLSVAVYGSSTAPITRPRRTYPDCDRGAWAASAHWPWASSPWASRG